MDVLIGGVGLALMIAALFGITNPKVYEDLQIPLNTRSKRVLAIAVGALFASIGLGWIKPPEMGTTASRGTDTALGATATAASTPAEEAPSVSTRPTGAPQITHRELHWTNAQQGGSFLDGGIYTPHKPVWLEEIFPSNPPSEFDVTEQVDPALGPAIQAEIRAASPPSFNVAVNRPFATSVQSWLLPDPFPGMNARVFTFRDVNSDGSTTVAGSIMSGFESIQVENGASGCLSPSTDGKTYVVTKAESCLQLAVRGSVDPALDAAVMVPWGADDEDLVASVQTSFAAVNEILSKQIPPTTRFKPDDPMRSFLAQNGPYLPSSAPDGWDISIEQPPAPESAASPATSTITVTPGKATQVRLRVLAPSPGKALIALKLIDPAHPGNTVISPLIPIEVPEPTNTPSATASPSTEPTLSPSPPASPTVPPSAPQVPASATPTPIPRRRRLRRSEDRDATGRGPRLPAQQERTALRQRVSA